MLGGVAGLAAVGAVVGVLGRLDPGQVGIQERAVSWSELREGSLGFPGLVDLKGADATLCVRLEAKC